jgi:hypothetical protein
VRWRLSLVARRNLNPVVRALVLALAVALLTASVVAADAFPIPGSRHQPSGLGWRLVSEVDGDANMAYRVRVASDAATLAALWHELDWEDRGRYDLAYVPPWLAVNFEREIVVLFGVGVGSCTTGVQLDDVVIDTANQLVYSVTSEQRKCPFLDLTGAAVFVVALDRAVLPPSPFTVQLHAEPTCGSCVNPDDRVTVSL